MFDAWSGRATGHRTGWRARSPFSTCCSSGSRRAAPQHRSEARPDRDERLVTVTGTSVPGRGLAPARPARAIREGERIHVVGAAGAGASAAVLHAAWAGGAPDGCDPGGPTKYT